MFRFSWDVAWAAEGWTVGQKKRFESRKYEGNKISHSFYVLAWLEELKFSVHFIGMLWCFCSIDEKGAVLWKM